MVGYSLFQTSTLGMRSQAHALGNIGNNVANVNTGGFKRIDTRFQTVLSETLSQPISDNGGVKPKDFHIIDGQGFLKSTGRNLDLAIVGAGFFEISKSFETATENFYTRDGSFRISAADTFEATTDADGNVASTPGYLIDKNGYYVLGWAANIDGTFTNGGTPGPMRVDPEAYENTFIATNLATLQLNLPSDNKPITDHENAVLSKLGGLENDALETYAAQIVDSNGKKQTATINFTKSANNQWQVSATSPRASSPQTGSIIINGTNEVGDTYDLTIDGTNVSYTTTGTEGSASAVRDALITAINSNATISQRLTASSGLTSREITLTANSTINSQVDTITLTGSIETGDQYSVTVDGNTASYTVLNTDTALSDIRDGLVNAINANTAISGTITAAAGTPSGDLTLTAVTAGTSFTSSASTPTVGSTADNTAIKSITIQNGPTVFTATGSATNATSTAQVDTMTIAGTPETGDQYSITINGNTVAYQVTAADTTLTAIRDNLITAINGDTDIGGLVTASAGGASGELTLTAKSAGSAFTSSVSTPTTGSTTDNTASITNTTANFLTTSDNTLTVVANSPFETTETQTLSFNSKGINTNSNALSFNLKFADGATSTFNLDVSEMTQFGRYFTPMRYSQNGLASGRMTRVEFDHLGHVIGSFEDGTKRQIYRIPLTKFSNPNGLEMKNGVFAQSGGTEGSGAGVRFALEESGIASLTPGAIELSNVDITAEFTNMIAAQQSYNSNATVFKTVDEMTMVARDLK